MSELDEWNSSVKAEFRANEGKVAQFGDNPMIIVHHVGRKSGKKYENPLVYQHGPDGRMFLIASFAGAPTNPAWYDNLKAAGRATVEVGADTFDVTVTEIVGAERDEIYAKQVAAMPQFGEYEEKTAGIRTIPVLALDRA